MARRNDGLRSGLIRGAAGLGVIGSIAAVAVYSQPAPRDEQSLCLKIAEGSGTAVSEAAHHLLMIDKTDKWNTAQGARLRNVITSMRDQLGVNERLSIFVFAGSVEYGFPPLFSLCNPGRASDTTIWTSNPRRWEKRFNESFGKPLDAILGELTRAEKGSVSPILEVLIDVSNREELNRRDIKRRIVLVSDMLQNSEAHTLYSRRILVPASPPTPTPGAPSGGPGRPLQLDSSVTGTSNAPRAQPPAQKFVTIPPRKLTPKEVQGLVERKGGLRHLRKFQIEIYQVRGGYSELLLTSAREFWDLVAGEFGAKIEWKVL